MYSTVKGYSGTLYPYLDEDGNYIFEDPSDHEESYVLIGPKDPSQMWFIHTCQLPPNMSEPVPWLP